MLGEKDQTNDQRPRNKIMNKSNQAESCQELEIDSQILQENRSFLINVNSSKRGQTNESDDCMNIDKPTSLIINEKKQPELTVLGHSNNTVTYVEIELVSKSYDLSQTPFDCLCNRVHEIVLPSKAWGRQKVVNKDTKLINFYECAFTVDNKGYILKQVTVKEDLSVHVHALRQPLTQDFTQLENNLSNFGELQNLLITVNNLKICVGGPYVSSVQGVNTRTAFLDMTNVWRHKLCEIIAMDTRQCRRCLNVERTMTIQSKRKHIKSLSGLSKSNIPEV